MHPDPAERTEKRRITSGQQSGKSADPDTATALAGAPHTQQEDAEHGAVEGVDQLGRWSTLSCLSSGSTAPLCLVIARRIVDIQIDGVYQPTLVACRIEAELDRIHAAMHRWCGECDHNEISLGFALRFRQRDRLSVDLQI